jgi:mono/diheme cytochrome c family protein
MKHSLLKVSLLIVGLSLVALSIQASINQQSALIEHGKYIVSIAGCNDCHTNFSPEYSDPSKWTKQQIQTIAFNAIDGLDENKYMAGGRLFDLGPGGTVYSANLTPDVETGLGGWTDEQIKVAIRTGQIPSGRILVPVMPYRGFNTMADADLDAVVAYLRSIPAVKNKVPEPTFSTKGFQPLPFTQGVIAPPPSDKAGRGKYLLTLGSCTDCHTPLDPATGAPVMEKYLAGGQPYVGPWGTVYGGNITPDPETGTGNWTENEIKVAFMTGINKQGRRLILMPWFVYRNLANDDADALAYYIKNGLPAVKNEVPTAALNEGFTVLAPKPAQPALMTYLPYIIAGVVVLVLVIVAILLLGRRKKPTVQTPPKQ